MKLKQLASAAVRFYALILVLQTVVSLPMLITWRYGSSQQESRWMFLGRLCTLVLILGIAAYLFLRSRTVVGWITPGVEPETETEAAPQGELRVLAFAVAGLVFLVRGLELIVRGGVGWYTSAGPGEFAVRSWQESNLTALVQGIVVTLIGLWLLLGSKGIMRAVHKLQRPPVSGEPTPEGQ